MSFTPKDWRDEPDHTTPITAAALEDLETRVTDYADTVLQSGLGYEVVEAYGAAGDGSTSDKSPLQSAVSAAVNGVAFLGPSPAGGGYAVPLDSYIAVGGTTTVLGSNYGGRIVRIGNYPLGLGGSLIFRNADATNGNSKIVFRDIWIYGGADVPIPQTQINNGAGYSFTTTGQAITVDSTAGFVTPSGGNQLRIAGTDGDYHTVLYDAVSGSTFTNARVSTAAQNFSTADNSDVQQAGIAFAATAIKVQSAATGSTNDYIRVENCTLNDWPGPAIHFQRCRYFTASGNHVTGNNRGGIITFGDCSYGNIENNVVPDCKDDAIALQAKYGTVIASAHHINILGNTVSHADEAGQATNNGISINGAHDCLIADNVITDSYYQLKAGIELADASQGTTYAYNKRLRVSGNRIAFTDAASKRGYGIALASGSANADSEGDTGARDITISNNQIEGSGLEGIIYLPSAGTGLADIRIEDNDLKNCGRNGGSNDKYGILVQPQAASTTTTGLYINRNRLTSPQRGGIAVNPASTATTTITYCEFSGNYILNPNASASGSVYDAIYLQSVSKASVRDNTVRENPSGTQRARYGIYFDSSCTEIDLGPNDVWRKDFIKGACAMKSTCTGIPTYTYTTWFANTTATSGTDKTPVASTLYYAQLNVPKATVLNGAKILNGSAVAGNCKLVLYDARGTQIAITASTALAGTAAYQSIAFTAPSAGDLLVLLPGIYYLGIVMNNTGNRFRAIPAGSTDSFTGSDATGSFTTPPATITPPTSFTADVGPVMATY